MKTSSSAASNSTSGSPSKAIPGFLRTMATRFQSGVSEALRGWERFWFAPRTPNTLGVLRLLVGGMLVYTHIVWGLNLDAFLGSDGWNSPEVLSIVQEGRIVPSFWWYVPDNLLLPVHCACIGVLVLFWIGFATRVTSVLSLLITISYCYRAHMANYGLDQLNAILCFYLCIGPCGAVLSVDRFLAVRKAKRKAAANGQLFVSPVVPKTMSANLALRLIQIHFCVIYAYAGLSKLQGPAWWSGEAVWMAFANLEYQSVDMTWVAWFPWISDLMTHSTIIWEVAFPAAIWVRPLRPFMLAVGFLLHAGIGGMMGMWTFALIMIFGHLSFWPRESIAWVMNLVPSAERLLGVTVSTAEQASLPELKSQQDVVSQPALLCVDRGLRRRLECLNYFLKRGFRCLATDDPQEALVVCDATTPDAVVVLGTDMPDNEIELFHSNYFARQQKNASEHNKPLFMVLTEGQSQRLNGNIHSADSYILSGPVSLGALRRRIQATLDQSSAHTSETGCSNDGFYPAVINDGSTK